MLLLEVELEVKLKPGAILKTTDYNAHSVPQIIIDLYLLLIIPVIQLD